MRMSQLKKLIFVAIVAAILVSISWRLRVPSGEWLSPLEKSLREGKEHSQDYSKLPLAPVDEKYATSKKTKKDIEIPLLEYEKNILQRDDNDQMQVMQEINELRHERLAKECAKFKLKGVIAGNERVLKLKVKPEILVSDEHKAIFCSTGSEHSEAWRKILGGDSLRSLFSYREESIAFRIQYFYKILLTEQPLVRFLSAYKKNLSPNFEGTVIDLNKRSTNEDLENLSMKIRQEFGEQDRETDGNVTGSHANLIHFAKFVIKHAKNSDLMHPMWERIHILCHPCSLHYDYISRDRTAKEDAKYIISKLENKPQEEYKIERSESLDAESIEEVKKELGESLLNEVYDAYKIDHDLFGYTKPWD